MESLWKNPWRAFSWGLAVVMGWSWCPSANVIFLQMLDTARLAAGWNHLLCSLSSEGFGGNWSRLPHGSPGAHSHCCPVNPNFLGLVFGVVLLQHWEPSCSWGHREVFPSGLRDEHEVLHPLSFYLWLKCSRNYVGITDIHSCCQSFRWVISFSCKKFQVRSLNGRCKPVVSSEGFYAHATVHVLGTYRSILINLWLLLLIQDEKHITWPFLSLPAGIVKLLSVISGQSFELSIIFGPVLSERKRNLCMHTLKTKTVFREATVFLP